jgi:hypothetical protein
MVWQGDHPIAALAQKLTFIADDEYEVTPLSLGFADTMNQVASKVFDKGEVHRTQSIFKKAFPPFGLAEGQVFLEYDLVYLHNDRLFWGRDMSTAAVSIKKKTNPRTCRSHSSEKSCEFQSAIQLSTTHRQDPGFRSR